MRDYVAATNASNDKLCGIFVDGHLSGCITLRDKGDHDDIGYWLGLVYRERGVMTEAVRQFVEHVNRPITARTLHDNVASRKILMRNGFTETNRDEVWIHYLHDC